jgi:hypothetical protein
MLIEVKVKVARIIDGKTRKRTETYIVDKELFSEAEYMVMSRLTQEQTEGTVESFEIQGLKMSQIKEVAGQFNGTFTYIITLKDIWLDDDGTEKYLKYKVLLDADDAADATSNALQLARQGYDMQVEGIKQVDYEYLGEQSNQEEEETENGN